MGTGILPWRMLFFLCYLLFACFSNFLCSDREREWYGDGTGHGVWEVWILLISLAFAFAWTNQPHRTPQDGMQTRINRAKEGMVRSRFGAKVATARYGISNLIGRPSRLFFSLDSTCVCGARRCTFDDCRTDLIPVRPLLANLPECPFCACAFDERISTLLMSTALCGRGGRRRHEPALAAPLMPCT